MATTDEDEVFHDPTINTVFSITRHDLHARHVLRALEAGKNIFVEKPLCLTIEELEEDVARILVQEASASVWILGDPCTNVGLGGLSRRQFATL